MQLRLVLGATALSLAIGAGCATSAPPAPTPAAPTPEARPSEAATHPAPPHAEPDARAAVVQAALEMLGAPYRYGGRSPRRGFDCSGLVVYSYAQAGVPGLPHSAASLADVAEEISVAELRPGDLLFFELGRRKPAHVGIYVGERSFIHAPSRGRRVERVSFDHVYWGSRLRHAGRLLP